MKIAIVYHSETGNTKKMADDFYRGRCIKLGRNIAEKAVELFGDL